MSAHLQLERLITRMLFDSTLVEQIYKNPHEFLKQGLINAEELDWIQNIDPRRWGADSTRTHRALEALLTHLPQSIALCSLAGATVHTYLQFFQSKDFHQSIQNRQLMSEGFSSWLLQEVNCPWPKLRAGINHLECAIAYLKAHEVALPFPQKLEHEHCHITLSPLVKLVEVPQGTLDVFTQASMIIEEKGILSALHSTTLDSMRKLLNQQEAQATPQVILIAQRTLKSISVSQPPKALSKLLKTLQTKNSILSVFKLLANYELTQDEATQLLSELSEEGLIYFSKSNPP